MFVELTLGTQLYNFIVMGYCNATLSSMIEAEQYSSDDNLIARATCLGFKLWPVTTKCTWIFVKTDGTASARSALSCATQSVTS